MTKFPSPSRAALRTRPHGARAQRGVSLLIVVVLLLTMGLMTLTAFYLSRGQYSLVGNIQQLEQAFNNAESVTASAEQWLQQPGNAGLEGFTTYSSLTPGLYPAGGLAARNLNPKTMTWDDSNSVALGQGRYLIEQLASGRQLPGGGLQIGQRSTGACRAVNLYRVIARSSGQGGSVRMIETVQATSAC